MVSYLLMVRTKNNFSPTGCPNNTAVENQIIARQQHSNLTEKAPVMPLLFRILLFPNKALPLIRH